MLETRRNNDRSVGCAGSDPGWMRLCMGLSLTPSIARVLMQSARDFRDGLETKGLIGFERGGFWSRGVLLLEEQS
jgi:hypothetical protein